MRLGVWASACESRDAVNEGERRSEEAKKRRRRRFFSSP